MRHTLKNIGRPGSPTGTALAGLPLERREISFLARVMRWSWIVLILVAVLQMIFFGSLPNTMAVGCVLLVWWIMSKLFMRHDVLNNFPLSAFLIIGFTTTQFYFPIVFTLLEGKPIIFNMDMPYEVFIHSLLAFLVLVAAHLLYRPLLKPLNKSSRSLLTRAGFFSSPTDKQLWIMGCLGLLSMFYVYFYSPSVGREVSGAGDKFIQGLVAFSYAPFFIPFGRLYGQKKVNLKRVVPMLILFTLVLFAVSLGRNSRSAFMLGFTSVGFAYILGLLMGVLKTRIFTLKNIVLAVIGIWFFTGPLADMATAMVIVRGQRDDISRSELISLTLEAYQNKEALQMYRAAGISQEREWDEQYMNNLFLARFSNLKYNDASLIEASKIDRQDPALLQFTLDRLWSSLPQPVLTAFGLEVDKAKVNAVSFGDFLHYKAGASPSVLGGFRTGHFAGTGMAAFGWWYLLILGVGMIPVYILYDKLFIKKRIENPGGGAASLLLPHFSLCGLLALTAIFRFLPAESVITPFSFMIRGYLQMLLLYLLVFHLTRYISLLIPASIATKQLRRRRLSVQ